MDTTYRVMWENIHHSKLTQKTKNTRQKIEQYNMFSLLGHRAIFSFRYKVWYNLGLGNSNQNHVNTTQAVFNSELSLDIFFFLKQCKTPYYLYNMYELLF